jgi:hypothetical protein
MQFCPQNCMGGASHRLRPSRLAPFRAALRPPPLACAKLGIVPNGANLSRKGLARRPNGAVLTKPRASPGFAGRRPGNAKQNRHPTLKGLISAVK